MKKILYFNCASGIAGDMIIASLIDAGLPAAKLERALKRGLGISGWKLKISRMTEYHYPAVTVKVINDRHFESPYDMLRAVKKSRLPAAVKELSGKIINSLIRAESRVHGVRADKVHFHELNALDTLVDVCGTCLALEMLGIDEVYSSPLNVGRPAPAAVELLKEKDIPVFSADARNELSTPTGTAIISNLAAGFGPMPVMRILNSGRGAGTLITKNIPNVLVSYIGTADVPSAAVEDALLLETNIDDMDPRIYPYVSGLLFKAGAKDVWLTQIMMKKGRPGVMLSVICEKDKEGEISNIIFSETTTLGIRLQPVMRRILPRKYGKTVKTSYLPNGKSKSSLEFETARIKAIKTGIPLKDILR
jgi:pyridinium-3,5-bisthiocarboxylic acid mononucleotide nickel chelatase